MKGVTIVTDEVAALRAVAELRRLQDRPHAWDTECVGVNVNSQSTVTHGDVICATCFCGDDADFGNGPKLFVDNAGSAAGLLERFFGSYFKDSSYKKVFHNYAFDAHLLWRQDIKLEGFHADTMHLARLYDTSLAKGSWEARALAEKTLENASIGGRNETSLGSGGAEAPGRRIACVTIAGRTLNSNCRIGQNTCPVMLPPDPPPKAACFESRGSCFGYGLKQLADRFKLSDSSGQEVTPGTFGRLFGVTSQAASAAHNSPEEFTTWVDYATQDAVLTYRVYEFLRNMLELRPWLSQVHMKPIREVLLDKRVADQLKNNGFSQLQFSTGKTMWDFYELYLRDFAECLVELERVGVSVDTDILRLIEKTAAKDIQNCEDEFRNNIASIRGPDGVHLNPNAKYINIASSQQMQTLLYGGSVGLAETRDFPVKRQKELVADSLVVGEASSGAFDLGASTRGGCRFPIKGLGLEPAKQKRFITASGMPSVSSGVLNELVGTVQKPGRAIAQIAERDSEETAKSLGVALRAAGDAKLKRSAISGFVTPLNRHGSATGRIHPSWAFDTSTGRLACRRPNLQNLPRSQRDPYKLRSAFRAPVGQTLVVADYSQLEIRLLAHITDCKSMITKLVKGSDYHSEVAAEIFPEVREAVRSGKVLLDDAEALGKPTVKSEFSKQRSQAKAVNFAIIYGMEAESLAEELNTSKEGAEALIRAWFETKPEVRRWCTWIREEATQDKRVLSILGRWRTLPLLTDENPRNRRRSERAGVNFAIQGSAADVVIAAMLQVWRNEDLKRLGYHLVLQVHDEIVIEGPEDRSVEASRILRDIMCNPFRTFNPSFHFRVPLTIDIGVGNCFHSAKA